MTLHQEASAAPVPKTASPALPDGLIAPAAQIFDRPAVRAALWEEISDAPDERTVRAAAVRILGKARDAGRAAIAEALAAHPFEAHGATRAYTWITDCLVTLVWDVATERLHRNATPTKGEQIAVMAVGGYGRGEMAPFSDVDLLFLTPYKITAWSESVIESMLYMLWDLKLKVGHSSRTVKECLRLGEEDFTIRTAMLENRFLTGHKPLGEELNTRLWTDLFQGTAREFVAAKLAERDTRHEKQGGQRYVVEPNVKEGKGGLRDLQSLYWITKYVHGTDDAGKLVALGVFRPEEYATFVKAETFLWAVRCHLHLLAGRPIEQLTFDMQVAVAQAMGYTDRGGRRAVEIFMQHYFRHATSVGDVTRILLTSLEADQTKDAPLLMRFFKRPPRVKAGYQVIHNRSRSWTTRAFWRTR